MRRNCFPSQGFFLVHEFIDSLIEGGQLVGVTGGSIGNAVLQMVFQDHLGGTVEGRAHRSQLHQDLGTIPAILHHALDRLQMADGPGQAVQYRLGLGVGMTMRMLVAVVMFMVMTVFLAVGMGMEHAVAMVMIIEFFCLFQGWPPENRLKQSYTFIRYIASPPGEYVTVHGSDRSTGTLPATERLFSVTSQSRARICTPAAAAA